MAIKKETIQILMEHGITSAEARKVSKEARKEFLRSGESIKLNRQLIKDYTTELRIWKKRMI